VDLRRPRLSEARNVLLAADLNRFPIGVICVDQW